MHLLDRGGFLHGHGVVAVELPHVHADVVIATGGHVLADEVGTDRQLTVAPVHQHRQADAIGATEVRTIGESLAWLFTALVGALLMALPVSWVYMEIREEHQYDQALDSTIVIMPVVFTGIVVIVQHSLALAFSLAGIAGAVRFRNSLKSSGDAVFILLAIGIGLAAGIGAVELAFVMSLGFNYCFMLLWLRQYGGRGDKRFMRSINAQQAAEPASDDATGTS